VDLGGDWVHATLEATLGPVADEAKRVDDPSPTTGCQRRLNFGSGTLSVPCFGVSGVGRMWLV
jgi:hypothetical protein